MGLTVAAGLVGSSFFLFPSHDRFRSMKSYEVKEIIERLKNAGEIQEVEIKVGGKGRPAKRFVAVDPTFFEDS